MKRIFVLLLILALAAAAGFYFLKEDARLPANAAHETGSRDQVVSFAGGTLRLPAPWQKESFGSRDDALSIKRGHGRLSSTVQLIDIRRKPVNAARFTQGWQAALGSSSFRPESLAVYHDAAVDSSRLQCVEIHWKGDVAPLQIVCVTADGLWKLVLLGQTEDVPGLDVMAKQMPAFERAL